MNMSIIRLSAAVTLIFAATSPLAAEVVRYNIEPGGQYMYLVSPQSPGLPGCSPTQFLCRFGIDGSFDFEVDQVTGIASLANVDLILAGNEDVIQNTTIPMVESEGVSDWLEGRTFQRDATREVRDPLVIFRLYAPREEIELLIPGPFALFTESEYDWNSGLILVDHLDGSVSLYGGYNRTHVDGDGFHFQLTAVAVPEPSTLVLGLLGLAGLLVVGRRRMLA